MMNDDDLREHWKNVGMPNAPKLNNKYKYKTDFIKNHLNSSNSFNCIVTSILLWWSAN